MTEMKDRIRLIMEAQHMSQQTFANFIGINAASLSSIFNDRTRPTLNTVEAIKSKIPNLNTDWLMFGHGQMFNDAKSDGDDTANDGGQADGVPPIHSEGRMPDLFDGGGEAGVQQPQQRGYAPAAKPEIRFVERPPRQIAEIRVFFDDGTYESFVPKK